MPSHRRHLGLSYCRGFHQSWSSVGKRMNEEPVLPLPAGGAEPTRRIFFGLWPSPDTAQEIMALAHEAHAECGARIMRAETLHLTLAFLGSTSPAKVL